MVIFRGKGVRIPLAEKVRYDTRVSVVFQPNAWCDEPTMAHWIRGCWRPKIVPNTLLIADVHRAQTIQGIKDLLLQCNTDLLLVPPGCTSLVQPMDVVFNKPFKNTIEKLATAHMQDNLNDYLTGKLTAC